MQQREDDRRFREKQLQIYRMDMEHMEKERIEQEAKQELCEAEQDCRHHEMMMMDRHVVTPQEKRRSWEKESSLPKEININGGESPTQCIEETEDKEENEEDDDDDTSY
eukprot:4414623-Ditylum_brightwellii.AAC.2